MTIHPCLLPTLFVAALSVAAAASLRRAVRKEYASLLPWLTPWGMLCTLPALAFVLLCLPPFGDMADWLNGAIVGTWFELLAGIAGVLPGLLWDEISERLETNRELPFRFSATALRTGMIAVLLILLLIPYGFLFDRRPAVQPQAAQTTEASVPNP
jgi:hypothetical protein